VEPDEDDEIDESSSEDGIEREQVDGADTGTMGLFAEE